MEFTGILIATPILEFITKKTENITGTINWKKFNEKIFIPEDCNAIKLKLLRDRSKKLDKFISGKVWIDDVEMRLIKNEIN